MYKDKGSRFLAFAEPVASEELAKERLTYYRKTYHDARHVCYAYKVSRLVEEPTVRWVSVTRSNDDGEPSGTAGKPILGRIESAGLDNILIVVVRYFGGVLLGTGGLVVAYREASADALAHATIVTRDITTTRVIRFPYEQTHDIMRRIKETGARILRQDWSNNECTIVAEVAITTADRLIINTLS